MRCTPLTTEIARPACLKWPALPSRTLARKLIHENPGVWANLESARQTVLRLRGRSHRKDRHRVVKAAIPSSAPTFPHNPEAYLPKSDEKEFLPFIVEVARDTQSLVMGDVHIPYHNIKAVHAAIQEGRRKECKIVVLNGDTLDFHRLSRFQKDPRSRKPKDEIAAANQLLDALDDFFPKARKIWKDGNHDERYDNYLSAHAEELFDVIKEHAALDKQLELESRGWEYVSEKRPIYLGKLTLIHGHEYPTPVLGPVNAARGLFLRAKESAMVNHHHQTSEHTEPTIRDKMITTWSVACLCDLHPMYARFNKWNHGAATVELAKGGDFRVHNFRIHGGRLMN
jgi:predicted phosphodiesterase